MGGRRFIGSTSDEGALISGSTSDGGTLVSALVMEAPVNSGREAL